MKIRNRELNIFSMSALDLFASALGAFIILAVVALPFFPNTSLFSDAELQARLEEAETTIGKLESSLEQTRSQRDKAEEQAADLEQRNQELSEELSHIRVEDMDLVILIDVTGSMGESVEGLKKEIQNLIKVLDKITPSLAVGIVAYGDRKYERPVTVQRLMRTDNAAELAALEQFVNDLRLQLGIGSGSNNETPEALHLAMARLPTLNWRSEAPERHVVIFTDAPPYPEELNNTVSMARDFASAPHYRVSAVLEGKSNIAAEALKAIAEAGNGRFVDSNHGETFMTSLLLAVLR